MKIILQKTKLFFFATLLTTLFMSGCKKNSYNVVPILLKQWSVTISSNNGNYAPGALDGSGTLNLKVYGDYTVVFDAKFNQLSEGIKGATINYGDPVTDGALILDLNPRIAGYYISGVVNINQATLDLLLNNNIDKYFAVTSTSYPQGIARAQLNSNIVYSQRISLLGSNVVPVPVSTSTKGLALLRITEDNKLYSKISISNNSTLDPVTVATINQGNAGTNGAAIFNLINTPAEFGVSKMVAGNSSLINAIQQNNGYISVASASYPFPGGKLRGQIR